MKRKSELVLNETAVATPPGSLQRITFNLQSNLMRKDTMGGKDYTVVPMVMITEGVANGSQGPLFYPADELERTPQVWNMKPVVVYHPVAGQTACDPVIIDNHGVGLIMNTKFEDGKLKAEAWLEDSRLAKVDNRVTEALEKGEMIEVSTGVFTDNEEVAGEFNGVAYNAIARNYRPDHLAILPDQTGACSIADGAGLLRLNQASPNASSTDLKKATSTFLKAIKLNETSHDNIRSALWGKLEEAHGNDAWIEDVFDNFIIFMKDGDLFRQAYTEMDGVVNLTGLIEEVVRVNEYRTLDGKVVGNEKESSMDRKSFVDRLIKNSTWEESDREFLMGLDEPKLKKMSVENVDGEGEGAETPPATPAAPKTAVQVAAEAGATGVAVPAVVPATENGEVTMEQYIANAPASMQDMLNSGMAAHNRDKAELIAVITANEKNVFTPEQLGEKDLVELQGLAALAAKPVTENSPIYVGAGAVQNASNTEEPLVAPTLNFSPDENK